jgi:RNA polymerase sigma-70 factor (ECF subfamily)
MLQEASPAEPEIVSLTTGMAHRDEEAYRLFYRLYFDRVLRYLLVLTRNEHNAREALQKTLLRVVRHARRFDSEAAFWNWLIVLAKSSVADEGRKSRRYLDFLGRFFAQKQVEESGTDADGLLLELLKSNMDSLPSDERELLQRKYLERESVRQIAQEMQLTEKAVESRLVRVRRRLRESIMASLEHEK